MLHTGIYILLFTEIQPSQSLQCYVLICDHTLIVLSKEERTCPPWAVPFPAWDPGLTKCTNVLTRSMASSTLFSTLDSGRLVTSNVLFCLPPSLQSTFSQQQEKYLTHAMLCHHCREVGTYSLRIYNHKSRLKFYKWRVRCESQVYDHGQTYKTAQTLLLFPYSFWDRIEDEINNLSSHAYLFLCCTILLIVILCYYIIDTI